MLFLVQYKKKENFDLKSIYMANIENFLVLNWNYTLRITKNIDKGS